MKARLIPLDDGPEIELVKELTVIGRKENCDLIIDHKSISKVHCAVLLADGLVMIRDLGSTNGTHVNGQRIRRAALLPNDQVSIASFKYSVTYGVAKPAPSANSNEHTQQLNTREVLQLLKHRDEPNTLDSDSELEVPEVQVNELPDAYPEPKPGEKKRSEG
ncbi:MAG: FHA domain-containing protein [Zavarzinella sp.]